jgi:hypothetical protein
MDSPQSRVGMSYVTGPADREYVLGAPGFTVYTVVSDISHINGCVPVENKSSGEQFPVDECLIDQIAGRP